MALNIREFDRYLQGDSLSGYEVFGAHLCHEYDQDGVRFTVYAPGAAKVEIIGSFNQWVTWPMQREESGIWSVFIGGAKEGDMYKYHIIPRPRGKSMIEWIPLPFTVRCGLRQPPLSIR